MHCFERAGLRREVAVSRTYYLREQARTTPATGSRQSQQTKNNAFLVAAEAFLQCTTAAVNAKERRVYYRNAADCFEHAHEDYRAAQAYVEAQEFTNAAKLFRKCAKFDEAVDIVKRFRGDIQDEVAENVFDVAKLFYFKGGEIK
jgi:hypothetical protein